jgi:hypothetical protein
LKETHIIGYDVILAIFAIMVFFIWPFPYLKAGGWRTHRFAVRSSAVGEDSEELSAAGQNESILGCTPGR